MKKLMLAVLLLGVLFVVGCTEDKKYTYTFDNQSSHNISITPDAGQTWTGFTLNSGKSCDLDIDTETIFYNYASKTEANGTWIYVQKTSGKATFKDYTITVKNNTDKKLDGSSTTGFSIHQLTWGVYDKNVAWKNVQFTPDTQTEALYPDNNHVIPTLKVGNVDTENAYEDVGQYLYFTLTQAKYSYNRTNEKIAIGGTNQIKSFTFYRDTEATETDVDGNEIASSGSGVVLVEETFDSITKKSLGKRIIPCVEIK